MTTSHGGERSQAVYRAADEQTKRGYNQAFFKKLYIIAEWDEDQAETSAHVSGAELTPPYALLLVDDLFEQAEAEARAIAADSPTQNRARSTTDALSTGPVSIYEHMAEREGFEPSNGVNPRYAISSRAHSTALAPLHGLRCASGPQKATIRGRSPLVGSSTTPLVGSSGSPIAGRSDPRKSQIPHDPGDHRCFSPAQP
jgi:hypothetical protein